MIVCFILLLLLLQFILMIAPEKPNQNTTAPFLNRYYAHRGLYTRDQSVAENTLPAFRRAVEKRYGIEFDIRFSKDEHIVVFHDDTLKRAAGIDQPVEAFTQAELADIPLYGTDARIPLFSEVLALVDGQVPLIIELKAGHKNDLLSEQAYEMLKHYHGPYCIESFDPRIVGWFRRNAPEVYRGQLACTVDKAAKGNPLPLAYLASRCMLNFLSRPNFIAYELVKKPVSVRLAEKMGAVPVCWTSHSPDDRGQNKMVIFEFYEPSETVFL